MVKSEFNQHDSRKKFLKYNIKRSRKERRYRNFQNELKYLQRLKALNQCLRLLDNGCGSGLYTAFFVEQGFEGYGIDIDVSLIKYARSNIEKTGNKAEFIVGRLEMLPYKDNFFDICVANAVLEHVQDWQLTLQEATRVLKIGGLLLLSTANRMHPFQHEIKHFPFYHWLPVRMRRKILEKIVKHRPYFVNYTNYPALNWFTHKELKMFLHDLGYKTFNRLDLIQKCDLKGLKAVIKPLLPIIKNNRVMQYVYLLYSSDVAIYAIKV